MRDGVGIENRDSIAKWAKREDLGEVGLKFSKIKEIEMEASGQHLRGHEERFGFYVGEYGASGPWSSRFGGHQPTRGAHGVEEPRESRSSATDRVLDGALLPRLKPRFGFSILIFSVKWKNGMRIWR